MQLYDRLYINLNYIQLILLYCTTMSLITNELLKQLVHDAVNQMMDIKTIVEDTKSPFITHNVDSKAVEDSVPNASIDGLKHVSKMHSPHDSASNYHLEADYAECSAYMHDGITSTVTGHIYKDGKHVWKLLSDKGPQYTTDEMTDDRYMIDCFDKVINKYCCKVGIRTIYLMSRYQVKSRATNVHENQLLEYAKTTFGVNTTIRFRPVCLLNTHYLSTKHLKFVYGINPGDVILVTSASQFSTNLQASLPFLEHLEKNNITVLSLKEMQKNPDNWSMNALKQAISTAESKSVRRSEKLSESMKSRMQRGDNYKGGIPKFGYKRVEVLEDGKLRLLVVPDEQEQQVIQEIQKLLHYNCAEIARQMNKTSLTHRGRPWVGRYVISIKKMLELQKKLNVTDIYEYQRLQDIVVC